MSDLYLIHHGVKGQRWGVRRYQNEDGTLTERGKKRYRIGKDDRGLFKGLGDWRRRRDTQHDLNVLDEQAYKSDREAAQAENDAFKKAHEKDAKEARAAIKEILKEAEKNNYTIHSRETTYFIETGKEKIDNEFAMEMARTTDSIISDIDYDLRKPNNEDYQRKNVHISQDIAYQKRKGGYVTGTSYYVRKSK